MKKLSIFLFGLVSFTAIAQTNFKWEKVDSVNKTKAEIYSDTKLFIAQQWRSAKDIIQNDDKETGVIFLKGSITKKVPFMLSNYIYVYQYSVTFKMKDGRFRISITDVYCEKAYMEGKGDVTKIDPFEKEECPETGTLTSPGLPKKKAIIMMEEVKADLQQIVDNYKVKIHSPAETGGEW